MPRLAAPRSDLPRHGQCMAEKALREPGLKLGSSFCFRSPYCNNSCIGRIEVGLKETRAADPSLWGLFGQLRLFASQTVWTGFISHGQIGGRAALRGLFRRIGCGMPESFDFE